MKSTKTLVLLIVAALLVSGTAFAEEEQEKPDYSKMKGIELYKSLCKPCHMEDSEAGEYTPMSLIMDQWDEVFDAMDESHAEAVLESTDGKSVPDGRWSLLCIDGVSYLEIASPRGHAVVPKLRKNGLVARCEPPAGD